jgi:hypothetical protein
MAIEFRRQKSHPSERSTTDGHGLAAVLSGQPQCTNHLQEINMMTRQASELSGSSPPRTRPMPLTALRRILPIPIGHLLFRERSDGFVW